MLNNSNFDFVKNDDLSGLASYNIKRFSKVYKVTNGHKIPLTLKSREDLERELIFSDALKVTTALGLAGDKKYVSKKILEKVDKAYKKFQEGNAEVFAKLFLKSAQKLHFPDSFLVKILDKLNVEKDQRIIKKVMKVANVPDHMVPKSSLKSKGKITEDDMAKVLINSKMSEDFNYYKEESSEFSRVLDIISKAREEGALGLAKIKFILAQECKGDFNHSNTKIFDACMKSGFSFDDIIADGSNIVDLIVVEGNISLLNHYIKNYVVPNGEVTKLLKHNVGYEKVTDLIIRESDPEIKAILKSPIDYERKVENALEEITVAKTEGDSGREVLLSYLVKECEGNFIGDRTEIFDACLSGGILPNEEIIDGLNILLLLIDEKNNTLLEHYINNHLIPNNQLELAMDYEFDGNSIRDIIESSKEHELMSILHINSDTQEAHEDFVIGHMKKYPTSNDLPYDSADESMNSTLSRRSADSDYTQDSFFDPSSSDESSFSPSSSLYRGKFGNDKAGSFSSNDSISGSEHSVSSSPYDSGCEGIGKHTNSSHYQNVSEMYFGFSYNPADNNCEKGAFGHFSDFSLYDSDMQY